MVDKPANPDWMRARVRVSIESMGIDVDSEMDLEQILEKNRQELDRLDGQLVKLINERARLVQQIGQAKAEAGHRVYAPDREHQVLNQVCAHNEGPITDQSLRSIYCELMSASLSLERVPRIAVLGPKGSFSHLAGRKRFGSSVEFEMMNSITAAFEAVEHGSAELALVPCENSSIGGVGETLDALIERKVSICGEVLLTVHHHLLSTTPLDGIKCVYSKPEVIAQCQHWLAATGLMGKTVPVSSSSAAAERAVQEPQSAAIAGELAGELFGLNRIAEYIEDAPGNITRFLILGNRPARPTGSDKTSVVFCVGHRPGKLVEALEIFRANKINMTRIESRRSKIRKWGYWFFVDIEGHADDPPIAAALQETAGRCTEWKILGSYPSSDEAL